jgi:O-succinylbenzoic acid--CoA ligase
LHERFVARDVACAIEDEGITRVSFVASMLERVLEVRGDERAPKALSLVLLGGGPAAADLLERAGRLGYPIAPTYGLTEAASQVATRPPRRYSRASRDTHESHDSHASHERGVRRDGEDLAAGLEVLPGVEIRIVDADRDRVAAGVAGEIQVRGPIVMCGYLEDPKATREALRDGWLSTGDVGRLDDEGRLRVLDRRADLIVSGGENIYPAEVESILVESEDVLEAGVYGIPDSEFGARPAADLVLREGAVFDSDALSAFCAHRMARYKCPVEFKRVEELPRTATGKLLRRVLRDRWEGR